MNVKIILLLFPKPPIKAILKRPISKRRTKNKNKNFVICFLIWTEKTNFKKFHSFFKSDYWIEKRKIKNNCFASILIKNKFQKKQIKIFEFIFWFMIQKALLFFNFGMKLKNEKRKIFKICLVFKSKNKLYF